MKSSSSSSQDHGVLFGCCSDGPWPPDVPASPHASFPGTLAVTFVTFGRRPDGFGGMKSSSLSSLAFVASGGCPDGARTRDDPAPPAG